MLDDKRYADSLDETRRWLQAELGVTVDADDPMLLPAMMAVAAMKQHEANFEDVARQAVEHAGEPQRQAMQEQIDILRRIAGHFQEASTESRHINDARRMLFDAINAMDADIKPLHSSMVLTREALEKHHKTARSPAISMLVGAALLVSGIALGIFVGVSLP